MEKMIRESEDVALDVPKLDTGIVNRNDAFEVQLEVDGFEPQDLVVNVHDNFLTLSGKHEERSPDGARYVSRQFQRQYLLPENVNQDELRSSLEKNGRMLKVEAPLRPAITGGPTPKSIPIEVSRGRHEAIESRKK